MVTINPNYIMRGVPNPYYDLKEQVLQKVSKKLNGAINVQNKKTV